VWVTGKTTTGYTLNFGTAAAAALPDVSDSFDRADSALGLGTADTGETWVPYDGVDGISSNRAYRASGGAGGKNGATLDCGAADGTVSIEIAVAPNAALVLYGRRSGEDNGIAVEITPTALNLYELVGGSFGLLDQALGLTIGAADVIGLGMSDDSLVVTENGTTRVSATSTHNQTVEHHGIGFNFSETAGRLDNFAFSPAGGGGGGGSVDVLVFREAA
jgi:hypothetical protein